MKTPPGMRARNRAVVEQELVRIGRRHLATHGAAALSLRAIARDLGMVPSALYRYVANRDDLLTLLIVDAFTSLGNAVEAAHDMVDPTDHRNRWRALAFAFRAWGLEHPHQYALIFGSPVPNYQAPAERTVGPGTRVPLVLARLLADAARAGTLAVPTVRPDPAARASVARMLSDDFFAGLGIDEELLLVGLVAWSLVRGAVDIEVFGQLGPDALDDPSTYFAHLCGVAERLVLRS